MSLVPNEIQLSERPFLDSDIDFLLEIEKAAGDAAWSLREIRNVSEQICLDMRVIVTPYCSYPIAFYVVEHGDISLYLCNIAVHPSWRRQGVASFALTKIADLGLELNYRKIVLHVQENNLPAQLLYRNNGYLVEEIRHNHYHDQDGFRMVKEL